VTVTALRQGGIDLLDPVRGTVVASYRMMLNPSWVEGIAYAGSELLVAKGRAGVERWDLQGQRLRQRYEIEAEAVGASPDRKWIAVQHGSRLQVIDFASGETLLRDLAISTGGQLFAFTPDSRLLAVARGGFVDVWDLAERRRIHILRSQESSVGDLAFAPDGSRLMAASGTVWDVTDGQRLVEFASPSEAGALSADGSLLFEGAGGVWATGSGERKATLFDLRAPGDQVVLTGEGGVLVLRTAEGKLYVWSARALAPEAKTTPHPQAVAASNAADLQRVGHLGRGRLREALWSPDDTFLAVNTTLNAIIYEAETLRRLRAFEAAEVVGFDPEGNALIGGEAPLRRIDPRTGDILEEYELVGIRAAAYSPDGAWLALAGHVSPESRGDGVALIALADGLLRVLDPGRNPANVIERLEFTSDSRRLVASHLLAVSIWEVETGLRVREPIQGNRRRAVVSPDGTLIAYLTPNWILVESLETGATSRRLKADGTDFWQTGVDIPRLEAVDIDFLGPTSLAVFYRKVERNSGQAVAAIATLNLQNMTGAMREASRMDLSHSEGTYTEAYESERPQVIPAFGLSPSRTRLYSLTSDGIVRVWNLAGQRLAETEPEFLDEMALSPDGATLVVPDAPGGLEVIDLTTGQVVRRVSGSWDSHQLAFSSPSILTVLQANGVLSQVDVEQARVVENWTVGGWSAADLLGMSSDGRLMAMFRRFAGDNRVLVFSLSPDRPLLDLGRFPLPAEPAFAPDGNTLALVRRQAVELWDLQRGEVRRQLSGAGDDTGILRFSPDGEYLITGRGEIWKIDSGDKAGSVEGPLGTFVVSPNGEVLIKNDGTLWDARDGQSLGRLEGVLSPAVQMAFTPDGRRLLWMQAGGVVEIWEIAP
jgi:WD40 repeat protein